MQSINKDVIDLVISLLPIITFLLRRLKEWLDTREEKKRAIESSSQGDNIKNRKRLRKLSKSEGKALNEEVVPFSDIDSGKLTVLFANDLDRVSEKLSPNFYLSELTHSRTARRRRVRNDPGETEKRSLELLAVNVLEPIRKQFPSVKVSSGFRSMPVNRRVGGKHNSQHMKGEAADLHFPGQNLLEVFKWIKEESGLVFDQLILEPGWIHVSYKAAENRLSAFAAKVFKRKRVRRARR